METTSKVLYIAYLKYQIDPPQLFIMPDQRRQVVREAAGYGSNDRVDQELAEFARKYFKRK